VLPFFHDFYSATWTNGDEQSPLRTGPVQDAARPWRKGDFGMTRPPARQIGDAQQFESGLTFPDDVNAGELRNGVPLKCWTQNGVPFEDFDTVADTLNCCLRSAYIQIVELLYRGDEATIADFFLAWLGPQATFTFVPALDLVPAMGIVTTPQYTLVFCSGTTSAQQLALQALGGLQGPQNFGNVSTTQLWFTLSSKILNALEGAGSDATKPIFLAGHSYGGAGVAVLAIRLAMANPARQVRIVTWAMPKPCDQAGIDQLVALEHLFLVNEGDFVPLLPLSEDQTAWFDAIVGADVLRGWSQWKGSPTVMIQSPDGRKRIDVPPSLGFNVLLPIVQDAITFQPVAPIQPHLNLSYLERSCLMCGCPHWPFTPEIWAIIFPLGCPPPVEALNAGLHIAGGIIDPPIVCLCCGASPVPLVFAVQLETPDYPELDGKVFLLGKGDFGPPCEWFGEISIAGTEVDLSVQDWSPEVGLPLFLSLSWVDSPYGDMEIQGTIPHAEFHCKPWNFDTNVSVKIDGVDTGHAVRFYVVPLPFYPLGLSIGAQVVDATKEVVHLGLSIGGSAIDP